MEHVKSRRIGSVINDLITFNLLCSIIDVSGKDTSLTQAAAKMKISPSGLNECLRRLKDEYGAPLVETYERSSDVKITEVGKIVRAESVRIIELHNSIKSDVAAETSKQNLREQIVRIGTSPFLLAHVFPEASAAFLKSIGPVSGIRIECEEGYYTEQIIERIADGQLDFAVLWNYPEKIRKAESSQHDITCAIATRTLDAVLVFGKDHEFFKSILARTPSAYINIEDLAAETLFVLENDHQPLALQIPLADVVAGGSRVVFTTFASIIGSIRAGLPGVAIIPGIYKELDRYRRDGSLYFLPLKSKNTNVSTSIEIIYMFRGTEPSQWSKLPSLRDSSLYKLRDTPREFLNYIESHVLPGLLAESGWGQAAKSERIAFRDKRQNLIQALEEISEFRHAFYVTPAKVGMTPPQWHHADVNLRIAQQTKDQFQIEGTMEVRKTAEEDQGPEVRRHYRLTGELIGNQVLCIKGFYENIDGKPNEDCFVINLNLVSPDESFLVGVLVGEDDYGTSDLACSFVLSRVGREAQPELRRLLHIAKLHTLIRTDVAFF